MKRLLLLTLTVFFSVIAWAQKPVFNKKDIAALKIMFLSTNNNLWEKVGKKNIRKPLTFEDNVWNTINWNVDIDGLDWCNGEEGYQLTGINWSEKDVTGSLRFNGFDNLILLSCYNNTLNSLEVKNLGNLQQLYCFGDSLKSLTVLETENLKELYCFSNNLDSLNLSGVPFLERLSCYNNQLQSLSVAHLSNLSYLDCSTNKLNFLDIHGLFNLTYLDCSSNNLDSLNFGGLYNLTELSCYSNNLLVLDLGQLKKLTYLNCFFNNLTYLDVNGLENLSYLSCWGNRIPFNKLPKLSITDYHYEFQRIFVYNTRAGARLDLPELVVEGATTVYKYGYVERELRPDGVFIVPADIRREGKLEIKMTNTAFPKFEDNNLPLILTLTL